VYKIADVGGLMVTSACTISDGIALLLSANGKSSESSQDVSFC